MAALGSPALQSGAQVFRGMSESKTGLPPWVTGRWPVSSSSPPKSHLSSAEPSNRGIREGREEIFGRSGSGLFVSLRLNQCCITYRKWCCAFRRR